MICGMMKITRTQITVPSEPIMQQVSEGLRLFGESLTHPIVDINLGTLHPKPITNDTKDRPGSPILRIKWSIKNAARDIYPECSSHPKQKNIQNSTGVNVIVVASPCPTPRPTKLANHCGRPI